MDPNMNGGQPGQPGQSLKRRLSKSSTESAPSMAVGPHPHPAEHPTYMNAENVFPDEWNNSKSSLEFPGLLTDPNSHMAVNAREFHMNHGVNLNMAGPPMQYGFDQAPGQRMLAPNMPPPEFVPADSQMLQAAMDDVSSMPRPPSRQKSAPSRVSANNEVEMRQLFRANSHRTLRDVALELHGNDRGPKSERARQIFAMLWVNDVCSVSKGSVPRGRVYANYASRCALERITVLNPASFGKLVRVLFPGLKTRRLGVRGESKYHYVNFCLKDDHAGSLSPRVALSGPRPASPPQNQSNRSSLSATSAPESLRDTRSAVPTTETIPRATSWKEDHKWIYSVPALDDPDQLELPAPKTKCEISFAPIPDETTPDSKGLALPAIEPFLPPNTDPDAAMSLSALYRSHCTSLVECLRYCKQKSFFHLFSSFQGTLTMPVLKLLGEPSLTPWIEECDFVTYQRMMRILSGLTLQVVPKPVLDTLRTIADQLVIAVREAFQGQPEHVILAKEGPAAIFASLVDRLLRVNLTAHAAANMLANPANRDQMYIEWATMVRLRRVVDGVPGACKDAVVNTLAKEMRGLVRPTSVPWEVDCTSVYAGPSLNADQAAELPATTDNVLDPWVNFLRSLPDRFPTASPGQIVSCVESVGCAGLRDITTSQGSSFGTWWVTKCWLDETINFMVEEGGFMRQKSTRVTTTDFTEAALDTSMPDALSGRVDVDFADLSQGSPTVINRFPPVDSVVENMETGSTPHDDSGIGIRTPEDFSPVKFGFPEQEEEDEEDTIA